MLNPEEKASVVYHNLFDFPLNFAEIIKWKIGNKFQISNLKFKISEKRGFYFIEGREGLIYKRLLKKRISTKKMKIAQNASKILSFAPGIKMVGVTGSLAMENSGEGSDIDLMIITQNGMLWTTRLLSYFVLSTMHFVLRRPSDKNQKDKLCLNMWLDESNLVWQKKDRNIYTAHEIAQIIPLVNKDKTYEKFLWQNKWILDFWPNAVHIKDVKNKTQRVNLLSFVFEPLAFWIQYQYMKPKITKEIVRKNRAIFHPRDWGKVVLDRLSSSALE